MPTPQTVTQAFVAFLEAQNIGKLNEDLYIAQVPLESPDDVWWITTSGGAIVQRLATGEKVKQYSVTINYRSLYASRVEKKLFDLEEILNCSSCVDLSPFEVHEIEATQYPTDEDVDLIERRVGFIQAEIRLYKKC